MCSIQGCEGGVCEAVAGFCEEEGEEEEGGRGTLVFLEIGEGEVGSVQVRCVRVGPLPDNAGPVKIE